VARSSLWARLASVEKRLPAEMPQISMAHYIVSPGKFPGDPPIDEGVYSRFTTQPRGMPSIDERWEPPELSHEIPPLSEADAARFFDLLGITPAARPRDYGEFQATGLCIWRNAPGGPAIAKKNHPTPFMIAPLWGDDTPIEWRRWPKPFTFTLDRPDQD
jgi:hypothetical protein